MRKQFATPIFFIFAILNLAGTEIEHDRDNRKRAPFEIGLDLEAPERVRTWNEEREHHPSAWSPVDLTVSGTLEITSLTSHTNGTLLVSGTFSGTLHWGEHRVPSVGEKRGFMILTKVNGQPGGDELLLFEENLIPKRVWSAWDGFQILAEDFYSGQWFLFHLSADGLQLESKPIHGVHPQFVTQPEDLPEGTGG